MSDFVKQLTDSIADQALELAELRQALAALTDKLNPPKPEPAKHDSRPAPLKESFEELVARVYKRAADHKALEASYMAKLEEGCPPGTWLDCGILRSKRDGKVVPTGRALEQQIAKAAAHDKAARAEDLAWRRSVEIPILHGADDDADDE